VWVSDSIPKEIYVLGQEQRCSIGNNLELVQWCNIFFLYIHGSVHRESNLITVQQDATYSVYYIFLYDTHESVPTRQREQMVVDPVN